MKKKETTHPTPLDSKTTPIITADEQLKLFINQSSFSIAMFDKKMVYLAASPKWISDYVRNDPYIIGRNHYEIFPEIPERWKEIHRKCLNGAVETSLRDSFLRADGTISHLRWEITPWRDRDGNIGGIIILTEETTEQNHEKDALKRTEEEFRQLAESMPQIVWITRADGWNIYFTKGSVGKAG